MAISRFAHSSSLDDSSTPISNPFAQQADQGLGQVVAPRWVHHQQSRIAADRALVDRLSNFRNEICDSGRERKPRSYREELQLEVDNWLKDVA